MGAPPSPSSFSLSTGTEGPWNAWLLLSLISPSQCSGALRGWILCLIPCGGRHPRALTSTRWFYHSGKIFFTDFTLGSHSGLRVFPLLVRLQFSLRLDYGKVSGWRWPFSRCSEALRWAPEKISFKLLVLQLRKQKYFNQSCEPGWAGGKMLSTKWSLTQFDSLAAQHPPPPALWMVSRSEFASERDRETPPNTRTVSHPHCALQIPFSLLLEPLLGRDVFPSWPGDLRDTFFWHKRMSWMEGMYLFPEPQADPTNLPLALYVVFY